MGGSLGDMLKKAGLEASDKPEELASPVEATDPEPVNYGPKVVVRFRRKGHGGKSVTEVTGVLSGRETLLAQLKKELGSGGRIVDDTLVLQGNQVERLARWLESRGVKKVVRS